MFQNEFTSEQVFHFTRITLNVLKSIMFVVINFVEVSLKISNCFFDFILYRFTFI